MDQTHVSADRAWSLIGEKCPLTEEEASHLRECESCAEFLGTFLRLARAAGFHISVELPDEEVGPKAA
jgi:hypothetical protein